MESVESFFLKYSFPCAHVLLETGVISKENYDSLEAGILKGELPDRKRIESYFPSAFRRIKKLADEMGLDDYWDMKVMTEYWYHNHNEVIDGREGNYSKFPESFCDFCKVHIAEVEKMLPENFMLVNYDEKKRPVLKDYTPDVKIGDKVRIHHAYAIEVVK